MKLLDINYKVLFIFTRGNVNESKHSCPEECLQPSQGFIDDDLLVQTEYVHVLSAFITD